MSDLNSDAGEIHKRLMKNHCPKCDHELQVLENTKEILTRYCGTCKLTIKDRREHAEFPENICD
jgi:transcription elongation factor Elf1